MRYMTIYNFEELSVEAKKNAIENVRNEHTTDQNPWERENIDSIRSVAKAIDCDYDIDNYNHVSLYFDNEYAEEVLSLEGSRAYAYIWNNFIEPNFKPKYLNHGYYSKITKEFDCPFTGYSAIMLLWDAWEFYKKNPASVSEFIGYVEAITEKFLDDDNNYYESDDYIKNIIEAEGIEFTENGDIV